MMTNSNKYIGDKTEKKFLEMIRDERGWAVLIPSTFAGQPLDVVAIVRGIPLYVDIKHCAGSRFNFSAIQDNQFLAMQKIYECSEFPERNYDLKVGFMIYFEVLRQWKFFSFKNYVFDILHNKNSIKYDDDRLKSIYER